MGLLKLTLSAFLEACSFVNTVTYTTKRYINVPQSAG